ncbi:MAG TPA: hypothetical protein VLH56_19660 [Dissulfurispiraceae bacterium]|nr:hypothetical protein [Dissulfurispiraceae bacterium]
MNPAYRLSTTLKKSGAPLVVIILVKIAVAACDQAGIPVDETQLLTLAMAGYAGVIGLINFIKNVRRK